MLVNLSPPPLDAPAAAPPAENDLALARRAGRDPAAFAQLYDRHVGRIYRYHLARTGDEQDAQDLTSQTFLAALEGIGSFRGSSTFLGWLFGIASHKVAEHYRRRRDSVPLESAGDLRDPQALPEEVAWQRGRMAAISRALRTIPPDRAEALVLRIFAGMSSAEAGQVMGKSDAAVRMLVHRGLRDLHKLLTLSEEVER
jgi:RNA polymerase sigma-70 factor (ECF subfamily)